MFSRLNKKCGKRSLTVAFMIALVGYGTLVLANSLTLIYLAATIFGFAYGVVGPAMSYYLGVGLRPDLRAPSMSVNSIFSSLGSFGAAFVMSFLRTLFGSTSDCFPFVVGIVFFAVCGLGFLFWGGNTVPSSSIEK